MAYDEMEPLIRSAQAGDSDAFVSLMKTHELLVIRVLNLFFRDSEAEDKWQEAQIHIYRKLNQYSQHHGISFRSWLIRVVRRRLLDLVKVEHRHQNVWGTMNSTLTDDETSEFADQQPGADQTASTLARREESKELVREAVAALPAMYREAVYLRDFEELSFAEIASVMETSPELARMHVSRGRKMLAQSKLMQAAAGNDSRLPDPTDMA